MVNFSYNTILIVGATSGIGKGLAEKFIKEGKKIVIVGRREEQLQEFAKAAGKDKVLGYEVFDISKLDQIPSFVEKVTKDYPDIDSVFLNSGIQRGFNFAKPETVDLSVIDTEITTDYTSYVHLTKYFLPFLLKKEHASLIYTSSGLALVPLARCPNYCAMKAALHQFLISIRYHLKDTSVQVLEIMPPSVQTELHDKAVQPDIEDGRSLGMPLEDFVEETWNDLNEGNPYGEFPIGQTKHWYASVEPGRKYALAKMPNVAADV